MKLRTITFYFFAFFITCGISAQNESVKSLRLDEVKTIAIKNSLETRNGRLDIEAAKKKIWETTAIGLPQINGELSYQYIPGDIPAMELPAKLFKDDAKEGEMVRNEMMQKSNTTYTLTASQLIFSGEYIVGLRASKAYKALSETQLDKSKVDVSFNVSKSFYLVLSLQENKTNLSLSYENLKRTYSEMEARVNVGILDANELDQISLKLNNLKTSLDNIDRNILISYTLLKTQMGVPLEDEFVLNGSLTDFVNTLSLEEVNEERFKTDKNTDFKLVDVQERLANLDMQREQSLYLPQVSGFYQYTGYVDEPAMQMQPNSIVGLKVTLPIFTSGSRYVKIKQKKIELLKVRNTRNNLKDKLNLLYTQNQSKFKTAYETFKNNKQNESIALKLYNNALAKIEEGMVTSLVLTQMHDQYLMSQVDLTNSMVDLLNAKLEFDKLSQ